MNHVGSSVNLHVVKDGKLLLMRRVSQRWMDGKLQVPGGKVEPGESPAAAVCREAREELGIEITTADITHLATVAVKDGGTEYFAVQFRLLRPDVFSFRSMEPEKCSELVWADPAALPEDTIELFKAVVGEINRGRSYLQVGY